MRLSFVTFASLKQELNRIILIHVQTFKYYQTQITSTLTGTHLFCHDINTIIQVENIEENNM